MYKWEDEISTLGLEFQDVEAQICKFPSKLLILQANFDELKFSPISLSLLLTVLVSNEMRKWYKVQPLSPNKVCRKWPLNGNLVIKPN